MIIFAKGVTSGYLPLGGVLVGPRVAGAVLGRPGAPGRCSCTATRTRGHAAACAAAEANLDILEREGLVARVAALEPVSTRPSAGLAALPLVGEIRTVGLTAAVAIDAGPARGRPGDPGPGRRRGACATGSPRASCAATRCTSRRPS